MSIVQEDTRHTVFIPVRNSDSNEGGDFPRNEKELRHPGYRPDIDGLRALAVLSVVGYHAFPSRIPGGFVGVDVFFVISGFLISTIILGNLEGGTFSYRQFYSRRIRRIFPALAVVLTSCLAFGWYDLLAYEYRHLGKHVAAGAGFVSNFALWQESGYFDEWADTKPLLHLWSLGIEEQFYIIWPLALGLAWRWRSGFLVVTLIVTAVSYGVNLATFESHPVAAFYSPLSRFWELMVGSILAYVALHRPQLLSRKPALQSVVGLLLIAASAVMLNETSAFPGWWALLPTIGTLLLIAAGPATWVNRHVLGLRLMVWVGLISYPLYLWHWPLLSFARIIENEKPALPIRVAAVLMSIVLAWITYRFLERPIRAARHPNIPVVLLVAVLAFDLGFGGSVYANNGFLGRLNGRVQSATIIGDTMQWNAPCIHAFGALFYPEFLSDRDFCHTTRDLAETNVFVIGDSHANGAYVGLSAVDPLSNYTNLGRGTCLPLYGVEGRWPDSVHSLSCQPLMQNVLEAALTSSATKIYLTGYFARYFDGRVLTDKIRLKAQVAATFSKLGGSNKSVVVILDFPTLPFDPAKCIVRRFKITAQMAIGQCRFDRSLYERDMASYRSILEAAVKRYPNILLFDPTGVFCDDKYCYGANAKALLYQDSHHLTKEGATLLATALLAPAAALRQSR